MRFLYRWAPPFIVMAVMFWFSSRPVLPGPGVFWWDFIMKKAAHLVEYAILFFTWSRAINWEKPIEQRTYLVAFVLVFAWAVTDEIHQSFTPNRHPSLLDVAIDMIGAILVYLKLKRFI